MNHRWLAGLVLLNAVLLVSVLMASVSPPAAAQVGGDRAAGQWRYTMLSGAARFRGPQDVVYIIDLRTQHMLAARFDSRTDQMEFLSVRRLDLQPQR